jgi:hypothetical protein
MCILKIFSESASFRPYAATTSLPVYSIHDANEIRRKKTGETYGVYRISFDVSGRDWDDFPGQVLDAIVFLTQHASAIRCLIESHPVSEACLDFPLWSRLDGNIINQNDHLSAELIALCAQAGIGIEMSHYDRAAFQATDIQAPQNTMPNTSLERTRDR